MQAVASNAEGSPMEDVQETETTPKKAAGKKKVVKKKVVKKKPASKK